MRTVPKDYPRTERRYCERPIRLYDSRTKACLPHRCYKFPVRALDTAAALTANWIVRGYAAIGLHYPKNPANVGGTLRAAGVYGAALVVQAGERFGRHCTDTMAAYRHIPYLKVDDLHTAIPFDCVPVAIDLIPGAKPLPTYCHPERAFYVFGPEDSTLGKTVTDWCRDVVYVPNIGGCMNLAATVNVVLYDRMVKRGPVAERYGRSK